MNIKLSTLTEAMDSVLEEATQEYDKATGEIHFIYDDMVDGEINQELEEYICESDDFIALPEKYEINDYEIMREFIYTLPNGRMQDNLLNAISGRGAFRRFREVLDDYGNTEKWYAYKEAAYEQIAREWAERHGIEIIEDIPSKLDALEMEATDTTDYEAAARYWTDRDTKSKKMPTDELMLHLENFVKAHNTCALATGSDGFVRCTPIEYNYVKGAFYMSYDVTYDTSNSARHGFLNFHFAVQRAIYAPVFLLCSAVIFFCTSFQVSLSTIAGWEFST